MSRTAVRLLALALAVVLVLSVGGAGGYYTAGLLFDTQQAAGNFSVATPENDTGDTNGTESSLVAPATGITSLAAGADGSLALRGSGGLNRLAVPGADRRFGGAVGPGVAPPGSPGADGVPATHLGLGVREVG